MYNIVQIFGPCSKTEKKKVIKILDWVSPSGENFGCLPRTSLLMVDLQQWESNFLSETQAGAFTLSKCLLT